ncbi:unnamed protein product [Scytosiphon promiscuus]
MSTAWQTSHVAPYLASNVRPVISGGRVWSSLKTNLSKHTCCFSDFRWPEDVPDFPSSSRLREYIQDYATHFDLVRHVRFGHFVTAVTPSYPDGDGGHNAPMWSVTFTFKRDGHSSTKSSSKPSQDPDGTTDESSSCERDTVHRTEHFDKCIIASGIFSEPNLPPASKVSGISAAVDQGWATHGAAYREPSPFAGKTVLVVGCAFSGAEIASDLSAVTKRCLAATGRPSIFLPRFVATHSSGGRTPSSSSPPISEISPAAEASSTVGKKRHLTESIPERSGTNGGRGVSETDGREHRSDQEGGACQKDQDLTQTIQPKVPLDLALYSLKSWAKGKNSQASAQEKREGARDFLVQLAGRDPGEAHEALRLTDNASSDHDPQASSVRVVVSDDFLDKVQDGSIKIRPRLVALDAKERTARFSDGTCDRVDHVVFCTGLRPSVRFLPQDVLRLLEYDEADLLQPLILHLQTWNPRVPDLGFVGVYRGPYFGSMELQARWLTRMWAGTVPLPAEGTSIGALEEGRSLRSSIPRPQFPTDYVALMEGLATAAGLLSYRQNTEAEDHSEFQSAERSVNTSKDDSSKSTTVAAFGIGRDHKGILPTDVVDAMASSVRTNAPKTVGSNRCTRASDADDVGADHAARAAMGAFISLTGADGEQRRDEDGDRSQDNEAIWLLEELMWSGPFLPCHYHVRQFLPLSSGSRGGRSISQSSPSESPSHAACPQLGARAKDRLEVVRQAIAEIHHVNRKLEKAHRAFS